MKFRVPEIVLGVLLTVAVFAMGGVFSSSLFPPQPDQQKQTQAAQSAKDGSTSGAIDEKADADERIANYTWYLTWLTFFTVVFNGALWVVTWRTLSHARKTDERQLRAYLISKHGDGARQGARRGFRFEFRPTVLNTGQTPAYNVRVVFGIQFLADAEAETFDYSLPYVNRPGGVTLGPNQDRFNTIIFRKLTRRNCNCFCPGSGLSSFTGPSIIGMRSRQSGTPTFVIPSDFGKKALARCGLQPTITTIATNAALPCRRRIFHERRHQSSPG